jgi:hypothetical protein
MRFFADALPTSTTVQVARLVKFLRSVEIDLYCGIEEAGRHDPTLDQPRQPELRVHRIPWGIGGRVRRVLSCPDCGGELIYLGFSQGMGAGGAQVGQQLISGRAVGIDRP